MLAKHLEDFISASYTGLSLDPEVALLALILIERLVVSLGQAVINIHTVRPIVTTALVLAGKSYYDEAVFLTDFSERVPGCSHWLLSLGQCEANFLMAIKFSVTVAPRTYAKYFFALMDMLGAARKGRGVSGVTPTRSLRRSRSSPAVDRIWQKPQAVLLTAYANDELTPTTLRKERPEPGVVKAVLDDRRTAPSARRNLTSSIAGEAATAAA